MAPKKARRTKNEEQASRRMGSSSPFLSRDLSLSYRLGDGRYNHHEVDGSGHGRLFSPPPPVSGGDDGFLADRREKMAEGFGTRSAGLSGGPPPVNPPVVAARRSPSFFLLFLLLGVLFCLGLRQAGRGYAGLTGEQVPAPLSFSSPAPYRCTLGFYNRSVTVDFGPLVRRTRLWVAAAGRQAAYLIDRLHFPWGRE